MKKQTSHEMGRLFQSLEPDNALYTNKRILKINPEFNGKPVEGH